MPNELEDLRQELEKIDQQIANLLQEREKKVKKIALVKKKNNIPIKDSKIEENKLKKCRSEYEKIIFKKIFSQSRKLQSDL